MKTGNAKIGDWVRPYHLDRSAESYKVRGIFEDNFGRVLLKSVGGFGYGEHYCTKVKKGKP